MFSYEVKKAQFEFLGTSRRGKTHILEASMLIFKISPDATNSCVRVYVYCMCTQDIPYSHIQLLLQKLRDFYDETDYIHDNFFKADNWR
jgi:hypothetical protein